jgi:hypothetical protein
MGSTDANPTILMFRITDIKNKEISEPEQIIRSNSRNVVRINSISN